MIILKLRHISQDDSQCMILIKVTLNLIVLMDDLQSMILFKVTLMIISYLALLI